MWAIEPGRIGLALQQLVKNWSQPKAVIIISAHWLSHTPQISVTSQPQTIHDFYGFPEKLYTLQYPAQGPNPESIQTILKALENTTLQNIKINTERGLDHGAWVPLLYLYPQANVPVLQISLSPSNSASEHYKFGQCLNQLSKQGIFIIGSGSLTHSLHELQPDGAPVPAYVEEFREWVSHNLSQGDISTLLRYSELSPAGVRAHPTVEHLMPLYVAMGAAANSATQATRIEGQTTNGVINMDAYLFGKPPI